MRHRAMATRREEVERESRSSQDIPPLPVLRERAGVRVSRGLRQTEICIRSHRTLTLTLSRRTGRGDQFLITSAAPLPAPVHCRRLASPAAWRRVPAPATRDRPAIPSLRLAPPHESSAAPCAGRTV